MCVLVYVYGGVPVPVSLGAHICPCVYLVWDDSIEYVSELERDGDSSTQNHSCCSRKRTTISSNRALKISETRAGEAH